jgi:hypothetical protein
MQSIGSFKFPETVPWGRMKTVFFALAPLTAYRQPWPLLGQSTGINKLAKGTSES